MALHDELDGGNRDSSELACDLLRYLFHEKFCPDNQITEEQKGGVLPNFFFGWCSQQMNLMNQHDICTAAGVPLAIWHGVLEMINSGLAIERTAQAWFTIVLANKPAPKDELYSINMVLNLTWADKTIATMSAFVSREMLENPKGFTDAIAASIISHNFKILVERLVAQGLNFSHDEGAKYRFTSTEPEDPYDVAMGCIRANIDRLKEPLREPVLNYMRLAQQCIRPPIPKAIIEAHAARVNKDASAEKKQPRGGWNQI